MPEVWFTNDKKMSHTSSNIAGGLALTCLSKGPDRKGGMENDFHPNCFACGSYNGAGLQLKFQGEEDGTVSGEFLADPKFESYSGIVHGGIIATLLDSAMTHCLFVKGIPAVTGRLSIKYSLPIRTGSVVRLEAKMVNTSRNIFILEGKVWVNGKRVASAVAKCARLR
jgi:uncharacterized protein (TIGR00369 family)